MNLRFLTCSFILIAMTPAITIGDSPHNKAVEKAIDPEFKEALLLTYRAGDYDQAIKAAKGAINEQHEKHRLTSDNVFASEILAASLYKSARYSEALKVYQALAKETATPARDATKHIFNLGNTHYKLGNFREAVRNYQEYLTKVSDPKAENNLRLALQQVKQKKEPRTDDDEDNEPTKDPSKTLGKLFAEFQTSEQGSRGQKINLQKW